jgi:hypothetical protein
MANSLPVAAPSTIPFLRSGDYIMNSNGIWVLPVGSQPVKLTTFAMLIEAEVTYDDGGGGAGQPRQYVVRAWRPGHDTRLPIPASAMTDGSWVSYLPPEMVVLASKKEQARVAIQLLSQVAPGGILHKTVYSHLGWARPDGKQDLYLHGGGALGPDGPVTDIAVELPPNLAGFRLPTVTSDSALRDAVRSSLGLLGLAPDTIIAPMLAAAYRAPLGNNEVSVFVEGRSGVYKSSVAAVVQQHYGAGLDAQHFPGSWASTGTALEEISFLAKDAMTVVDDYVPRGGLREIAELRGKAERLFRGVANAQGRARGNQDGSLRPARPPRGLVMATGEDLPTGGSLLARVYVVQMVPGAVELAKLTADQERARDGVYALAMAGYVGYLAPRRDLVKASIRDDLPKLRDGLQGVGSHARTPLVIANLVFGWQWWLRFAEDIGAVTADEHADLVQRVRVALIAGVEAQVAAQSSSDPVDRFLMLVADAMSAGAAHVATRDGTAPESAGGWGWRNVGDGLWLPRNERVGWLDGDALYLLPSVAASVANKYGRGSSGEGLAVTPSTLGQRLHERGFLVAREEARGVYTVRKTVEGVRRDVWHLSARSLGHGEAED